ncbi:MAG TPA: N-acetylmuramoyl-L-alanine amidase [Candidatus Binatus sp.]|nr:N-acetylmuramoyl-L-alanine amidase [Candidatus Binatus sp.]
MAPTIESTRGADEDKKASAPLGDKAQVTGLRFLSSKSYTRVMLDLSQEAKFEVRQLKEDPAHGAPPRIYVDINGARLALASKEPVPVDDELLRQVRVGQYSTDVVRVVLDMNSVRSHKAFLLPDPYRLVIDVEGQRLPEKSLPNEVVTKKPTADGRKPAPRSAKAAPATPATGGIRKIVLDPGHGGKDPGAIGPGGAAEKDIVLSVAKKLAVRLRSEMGIEVVLTRKDDRFIALEDRTAMANSEDADLFISLHMNASVNPDAKGIETYYLDNTTDEAAVRLAARENSTARKNISDLQFILSDMTQNMKLEDSITLAHRLQGSLVSGMSKVIADVRNLGVKTALFYVLVGAHMPSVLVEMFFITHRTEGRAMTQDGAQDAMVEALMDGIQKYSQSTLIAKTL